MKGIGALMEGASSIPVLWEMFFSHAWEMKRQNLNQWLKDYTRRRYGADSDAAIKALQIMNKTVYSMPSGYTELPKNSVVCARPSLNPDQKARRFTQTVPGYDTTQLAEAWKLMLDAAEECSASDGFRFDLVDLGRQVLGDLGTRYHHAICTAWKNKDAKALKTYSEKMLRLIKAMDVLTGTRQEFLFGVWQHDARGWGRTNEEKALCERNARELVTTWTVPPSHVDYANREWSGLLGDYYYMRWKTWLNALRNGAQNGWKINVRAARNDIEKREVAWTRETKTYPAKPHGDEIIISQKVFKAFAADALSSGWDKPNSASDTGL